MREACFATSHCFVPDFLVSILLQPAIFFFFGTNSILLTELLFMICFVIVCSVTRFLEMPLCYYVKFWAPFSGLFAFQMSLCHLSSSGGG